ncbi:MAG: molybdopterin cofactor-binding domain-containing protein, partial [Pseudomonadota bacterium]
MNDPNAIPVARGAPRGSVGQRAAHESAEKHVSGTANYIDDMLAPANTLHAYVGLSTIARGRITAIDLAKVREAPGVVDVLTRDDIPGHRDIGPVFPGDPLLIAAGDEIEFHGQVLFSVAAESYEEARRAAQLAQVSYEELPAILTIEQGLEAESFVRPPHTQQRGDLSAGFENAAHCLEGRLQIGGQEQMYLEGQVSLCVPEEDGGMLVYSSTQ